MTDPTGDQRLDPRPPLGTELQTLTGYLDAQRETLLRKAVGLSREDLARTHPPSTLTVAALLNHCALNEDWWFGVRFAGEDPREPWASADWEADPDWEMTQAVGLEPDELRQRYVDATQRSRAIVAASGDPAAEAVVPLRDGSRFSLRWVLLHMIEETARHAGHADLIRESIDGETGE